MSYGLIAPCEKCPFRTDIRPYIRSDRVREILSGEGEFYCHKTVASDGKIDEGRAQVCAGFLICLEHEERPNQMMRIAERLGMYDRSKLRMDAPVYHGRFAAIRAHRKRRINNGE